MNRKMFPLFLMLLAGTITWILTYLSGYKLVDMLIILFFILLAFYIVGLILKKTLDLFDAHNKKVINEGEVIEKEEIKEEKTADAVQKKVP